LPLKIYLFFIIVFFPTHFFNAQTTVSGTVYNENQIPLSGVLVVNINSEAQAFTDENGQFFINANNGNELRFIRQNYERISLKVNGENFISTLNIQMKYSPKDIEAVTLNYKPTGNLKEDIKHYGAPKNDLELNKDLGKYNHSYSSREILKPKIGEFVQPKGPGFEVTKIGYQWTILDVEISFEKLLSKDYFKSLGLQNSEISPFIIYTLKNFNTEQIRRFGRINSQDLAKFQVEAEKQIIKFKEEK
jgi:hypothetical protein